MAAAAAAASSSSKFKDLLKKYGKVALGVHFSVSAVSIASLYVAIKNNVDVDSFFSRLHLPSPAPSDDDDNNNLGHRDELKDDTLAQSDAAASSSGNDAVKIRSQTAEIAASAGGALGLSILCNKALFPVRVPITLALTPPIARFLARRKIIKDGIGR